MYIKVSNIMYTRRLIINYGLINLHVIFNIKNLHLNIIACLLNSKSLTSHNFLMRFRIYNCFMPTTLTYSTSFFNFSSQIICFYKRSQQRFNYWKRNINCTLKVKLKIWHVVIFTKGQEQLQSKEQRLMTERGNFHQYF